jgi:cold shock CspA family protein
MLVYPGRLAPKPSSAAGDGNSQQERNQQRTKRRFARDVTQDAHFVHISAVERAGLSSLNEGAKVSFEEKENRGKSSAENLRVG